MRADRVKGVAKKCCAVVFSKVQFFRSGNSNLDALLLVKMKAGRSLTSAGDSFFLVFLRRHEGTLT